MEREFKFDLENMGMPDHVGDRLSRVFTLTRLRGSVAVAEYLKTTSVARMAKSLGHKEYKKNLIDHYLPEPIRQFFEERWVRIFQSGIICEAMKGSPFMLEASGFESMVEVDTFLRNHVISFPKIVDRQPHTIEEKKGEVIFGLNDEVLRLMVSIAQYDNQKLGIMTELAQYWSKVANKLINFIKSDACKRPDIKAMLERVNTIVEPKDVKHIVS